MIYVFILDDLYVTDKYIYSKLHDIDMIIIKIMYNFTTKSCNLSPMK